MQPKLVFQITILTFCPQISKKKVTDKTVRGFALPQYLTSYIYFDWVKY